MNECVPPGPRIADPVKLGYNDPEYPQHLKTVMGADAPTHIYITGNPEILKMKGIGFSGSRKSSDKGLQIARDCATQAAENNLSVISGNAAGIDFQAHYHCLSNGGKTILVLPEGLNNFRVRYALEHVWNWENALVVSQYEPDDPWKAFRAFERNKLIIGLSQAMIIAESGESGGTMHAGEQTLRYGLPLYVAIHEDMSLFGRGNQILLEKGAQRLTKSKATNKANLTEIFENIQN